MVKDNLYSIGQAEKICNVSQRMLRYYEKQGLIQPDEIDPDSRYRYYSIETLRRVQTVRYLIDQGFVLEEIGNSAFSGKLDSFREGVVKKIQETQEKIDYYYQRMESLKQWGALLLEGEQVLAHRPEEVSVRYYPRSKMFFCKGEYGSEAEIETAYFTQSKQDGHTMVDVGGAFNYYYESFADRLAGRVSSLTLMQTVFSKNTSDENVEEFGGFLAARCYHIGSKAGIGNAYERILRWCGEHGYTPWGDAMERNVLDVYSTQEEEKFVTELILPVTEEPERADLLYQWTTGQQN